MLRYDGNIILSFLKCDIKHDQPPSDSLVDKITGRLTSLQIANYCAFGSLILLSIAVVGSRVGYYAVV